MEGIKCPNCGTINPPGFRFCGQCGTRLDEPVPPPEPAAGTAPAPNDMSAGPKARLVVIEADGSEGDIFEISTDQAVVLGRTEGDIIRGMDPYLSPRHASFTYREGSLVVEDLASLNGVYYKITEPVSLQFGDIFMVGRHFFKVEKPEDLTGWHQEQDGTYLFYTGQSPAPFIITEIEDGGYEGSVFRPVDGILTLGREGNLVDIQDDPFVSSHHAILKEEGDGLILVDQGSKNGTFIRIKGSRNLVHGDFVFIGSELMRVEIV